MAYSSTYGEDRKYVILSRSVDDEDEDDEDDDEDEWDDEGDMEAEIVGW